MEDKIRIYKPLILTDRREVLKYVYDWYNWPRWGDWGRKSSKESNSIGKELKIYVKEIKYRDKEKK